MRYPKKLEKGDVIGVCAPSSGLKERHFAAFDNAIKNVKELGFDVVETAHVRTDDGKCTSASPEVRAKEFMELYENPKVRAILPPWGGEFLMEILPIIDFDYLKTLEPKWIIGYSDTTTLTFPFTIVADVATIHGSNLMNMGMRQMGEKDKYLFEFLGQDETVQYSSEKCGGFTKDFDNYDLNQVTEYKSLSGEKEVSFSGRMIGGCLDVIANLIGTRFDKVAEFAEKYKDEGLIWTIESCEMSAARIYRTLWQMKQAGWFEKAKGVLVGRPEGYSDNEGFEQKDALHRIFDDLKIPVIYDVDVGHKPPQLQIMNGAWGEVEYENGKAKVIQKKVLGKTGF